MKNYFAFEYNIASFNEPQRNFRFLFKSPGTLRHGDLSDAIEESAASVLAPDGIAIVCIDNEFKEIEEVFQSSSALKQAKERLGSHITLCICQLDESGELILKTSLRNQVAGDSARLKECSKQIFDAGLNQLFSAHHVLVTAPPGFTFVKPSGERSTHFLRTEDALTDVENVQFLSYALLHLIKARQVALGSPVDVICIDTMAIASVAYALRDLYCVLFKAPKPRVVSFHSHEGLASFDFPISGTSFCIISASSSMRLERLWRERSQCHPTEVVTLLTFKGAQDAKRALFAITDNVTVCNNTDELRDIRMAGERFAPEDLKPRKVLLRKEKHKSPDAEKFSKVVTEGNCLVTQGCLAVSNPKIRPIFLNGTQLADTADFKEFLNKILQQKVPASISAIVCQDDDASQSIASTCKKFLELKLALGFNLPIIKHSELGSRSTEINREGALMIISAVVGRGSKLLAISRDLRPVHVGARTYLIGAQIAETQAQISSLKNNLRYSAEGAAILVEHFTKISIGSTLQAAYRREHMLLTELRIGDDATAPLADRRKKIFGTSSGMHFDPILPCGTDLATNLSIRPDFAYWDFKYENCQCNTPAVLATVAAILQNARESTELEHQHRLNSDAFQQVVLDPENFARYNDGVIQGALLRAAYPSELDYSSERDCSYYMCDLVSKIIIQHEKPQGEAALEFALALRTDAIKLVPEHKKALMDRVATELTGDSPLTNLLRLILGIDKTSPESSLPDDF